MLLCLGLDQEPPYDRQDVDARLAELGTIPGTAPAIARMQAKRGSLTNADLMEKFASTNKIGVRPQEQR